MGQRCIPFDTYLRNEQGTIRVEYALIVAILILAYFSVIVSIGNLTSRSF